MSGKFNISFIILYGGLSLVWLNQEKAKRYDMLWMSTNILIIAHLRSVDIFRLVWYPPTAWGQLEWEITAEEEEAAPSLVRSSIRRVAYCTDARYYLALLLRHWYEIMALYYVKSVLTEISASRQDRRVLQKSKIIKIKFLSIWGMLQTFRYV